MAIKLFTIKLLSTTIICSYPACPRFWLIGHCIPDQTNENQAFKEQILALSEWTKFIPPTTVTLVGIPPTKVALVGKTPNYTTCCPYYDFKALGGRTHRPMASEAAEMTSHLGRTIIIKPVQSTRGCLPKLSTQLSIYGS